MANPKTPEQVDSFKRPVAELAGVDQACDAIRRFRAGKADLAETGGILAGLTAAQLDVVAFCMRCNVAHLRALRDQAVKTQ